MNIGVGCQPTAFEVDIVEVKFFGGLRDVSVIVTKIVGGRET